MRSRLAIARTYRVSTRGGGSFFFLARLLVDVLTIRSVFCVNGDTRRCLYAIREWFVRVGLIMLSHLGVGVYHPSTCLGLGFAVGEPTTCQHNLIPTFTSGFYGCSVPFVKG